MPDHNYFANLIWQIADLLRGPYRPPQYERVMLPMTVLRRFDCVLAPTKAKVLAEHDKRKGGRLEGEALDTKLNEAAGQRFHNHSPLNFGKLKGDPDHIEKHLVSYIKGFSANVRRIHDADGLTRAEYWDAYDAELNRLRALPGGSGGNFYLTLGARASKRFARALVASTFEGRSSFTEAFRLLGFKKMATFRELGRSLGLSV